MVSDIKVSIKNLYKIFGPNGKDMVQKVEDGATSRLCKPNMAMY